MLNNIKTLKSDKGFTIVELLIVIVVIAILAAITIVAYNGIQNRGKAASAQSLANGIAKKAEIYNTEPATTGYPLTLTALTGAASSATYAVESSSLSPQTSITSATTNWEKAVIFQRCGHNAGSATPPAAIGNITVVTGVRIGYFDGNAIAYANAGQTSTNGTAVANTNPAIGCHTANS